MSRRVAPPAPTDDEFEAFWRAYPATWKGRPGKKAARTAFDRAAKVHGVAAIMEGLAAHLFDHNPRYIPHASTWLNGERFLERFDDLAVDPWGLGVWIANQPDAPAADLFSVRGYNPDALTDVMLATGLPATWRGDLDVLGGWIASGHRPDSVAEVIAEICASGAAPPRSLGWLDRRVRAAALRWNARRHEWVRG